MGVTLLTFAWILIGPPVEYGTFLASRPDEMEIEAIQLVCKLCLQYQ